MLGIRIWGRRMVDADETTELWLPPQNFYSFYNNLFLPSIIIHSSYENLYGDGSTDWLTYLMSITCLTSPRPVKNCSNGFQFDFPKCRVNRLLQKVEKVFDLAAAELSAAGKVKNCQMSIKVTQK